jgi:chemotaxis protein MotB
MRRSRRPTEPENHERWLVSYADFITLLFAFFVMMYAHSQTDKQRAQQISKAFREAMQEGKLSQTLSRLIGSTPPASMSGKVADHTLDRVETAARTEDPPIALLPSLQQLQQTLRSEIASGKVVLRMEQRGLVISLLEATFFPSGGDIIESATLPTLDRIAEELRKVPNPLRLEGHTDSIPIRTPRFRSNWELSAARGIAMLELFQTRFGIPHSRMAIAGYADTAPVASNQTLEGRSRNRRVDIVVLNQLALQSEPPQAAAVQSP